MPARFRCCKLSCRCSVVPCIVRRFCTIVGPGFRRLGGMPTTTADECQDGIELREMDSTRHTEAARIRLLRRFVDAAGSGDHDGWQSPATLVQICSGELVLSTLQRAMQSSPASSSGPATPATQHQQQFRSLAHCALAAAAALSGGAPAPAGASCEAEGRRKILILEGVELAARRACKRGTASHEWAVASRIVELLPALVAALAVRHRVVALPRASRERTLRLLYALGHAVREHELLTRE
ncbi:unnamed protein product [Prorocentrum cordatum]|uniref:Peroxisomal membrane protein PEX16 n=1 Tax=Prorocentrum cordatum TaxID=2364126 RepID=A0ABN9UX85_9DINO|nr:unnamed protein product [Polarella glacialis]